MRLTHSSHLSDYIPLLLKQEKTKKICAEIEGTLVSAIFDGTTCSGEALVQACILYMKVRFSKDYSLSTLSWRGRKTDKIGIHLTENGSNQRHVIFDGR